MLTTAADLKKNHTTTRKHAFWTKSKVSRTLNQRKTDRFSMPTDFTSSSDTRQTLCRGAFRIARQTRSMKITQEGDGEFCEVASCDLGLLSAKAKHY